MVGLDREDIKVLPKEIIITAGVQVMIVLLPGFKPYQTLARRRY
jgi:hypothetical protein